MPKPARTKSYDIIALEYERKKQGFNYKELAKLAHLTYDQVYNLLSPAKHRLENRQFQYFRKPNNILRIAFALQLKEDQYIKEVDV
jgi:hypothetical protein